MVVEPIRRGAFGGEDDAQQRLAQRVAPRAHRAHVPRTGPRAAHRVRVQEPDDVAAGFFARQCARAVGGDGCRLAGAVADAAGAPDATLVLTDERPAFLASSVVSHHRPLAEPSRSTPTRLCRSNF
jgi:hypothetical protein